MTHSVLIVGAGPAGLALAIGLAKAGIAVTLVERQAEDELAEPAFDGREIALTHASIAALKRLGAWERIGADAIHPLAEARVFNGASPLALSFAPDRSGTRQLGSLVSNCDIRRALFAAASEFPSIELVSGIGVARVATCENEARIWLDDGSDRAASLLVAADSRFSAIRGQLGISARMNRLGKSMLVGRVAIERDHGHVATEWFDHGQTLALLPLGEGQASAVVTLPDGQAQRLAGLDEDAMGAELTHRFARRFGEMRILTPLHLYPLTTTYAHRFITQRSALVGDAAVGMHPVTAHGFNLGLTGTECLSRIVESALRHELDPGHSTLLRRYQREHRAATWPLYTATNAIVGLYTDERRAGLLARQLSFRAARFAPARKAVSRMLMQGA
ncbi:5-demethoxyubiquinol-8 5-hydroxylase UbiM [Erythrobacter aureus]|uniref:FAD-dependent hydroxylase n=1 Tax=Erythrobacter aureus TaxID=2182384 RepID=A0A345YEE4_9SPHN|nr:5-demethoxyubiquinol-8 5-hydroxylase UbiM [Erythrobacter aureus]AXK42296.1 FAD-dependent hydroxylase [Erythrobacter aureus]